MFFGVSLFLEHERVRAFLTWAVFQEHWVQVKLKTVKNEESKRGFSTDSLAMKPGSKPGLSL